MRIRLQFQIFPQWWNIFNGQWLLTFFVIECATRKHTNLIVLMAFARNGEGTNSRAPSYISGIYLCHCQWRSVLTDPSENSDHWSSGCSTCCPLSSFRSATRWVWVSLLILWIFNNFLALSWSEIIFARISRCSWTNVCGDIQPVPWFETKDIKHLISKFSRFSKII